MARNTTQFANFICKFNNEDLIDQLNTIIIPAFLSPKYIRKYSKTRFFFRDVKIINFGNEKKPELVIAGRFIKDTVLRREQVYDHNSDEIVENFAELDSSPSSIFALRISDHKLILNEEVSFAPGLNSFGATTLAFLKRRRNEYIRELVKIKKSSTPKGAKKPTVADIDKRIASPTLDIIPISSHESIEHFISAFKEINKVNITLLSTNQELDNDEFFLKWRDNKTKIAAKTSTLTYNNSKGLKKSEVLDQTQVPAQEGNTRVTISGWSKDGQRLSGDNESFRLKVTQEVSSSIISAAKELNSSYNEHIKKGALKPAKPNHDTVKHVDEQRATLANNDVVQIK